MDITALKLAQFAEKNGWIVIEKGEDFTVNNPEFIRYLTPSGNKVLVEFHEDGSIWKIYP